MGKLALVSFHSTGSSLYLQFELLPAQWQEFRHFLEKLFPASAVRVLRGVRLSNQNFHFQLSHRGMDAHLVIGAKRRVHVVFHLGGAKRTDIERLLSHTSKLATHFPERRIPEKRAKRKKR